MYNFNITIHFVEIRGFIIKNLSSFEGIQKCRFFRLCTLDRNKWRLTGKVQECLNYFSSPSLPCSKITLSDRLYIVTVCLSMLGSTALISFENGRLWIFHLYLITFNTMHLVWSHKIQSILCSLEYWVCPCGSITLL